MDTSLSRKNFLITLKDMGLQRSIPNISWTTAHECQDIARTIAPSKILEIGPANGFSTLIWSEAFPSTHISSIEISRHAFEELGVNIQTYCDIRSGKIATGVPAHF